MTEFAAGLGVILVLCSVLFLVIYIFFIRKQQEKAMAEELEDLQQKLKVATVSLQQALGSVSAQAANKADKVRYISTGRLWDI